MKVEINLGLNLRLAVISLTCFNFLSINTIASGSQFESKIGVSSLDLSSRKAINRLAEPRNWQQIAYANNYVTSIEDNSASCGNAIGMLVMTSDHNYAIYSPCLLDGNWQSVTVNGNQVFVLDRWNKTLSTTLKALGEQERDFIAEARSNFTQNLAGLKLARYTSGGLIPLKTRLTYESAANNPFETHKGSLSQLSPSVAESVISKMNELNEKHAQLFNPAGNEKAKKRPSKVIGDRSKNKVLRNKSSNHSKWSGFQQQAVKNIEPSSAGLFRNSSNGKKSSIGIDKKWPRVSKNTEGAKNKVLTLARARRQTSMINTNLMGVAGGQSQSKGTKINSNSQPHLCSSGLRLDSFNYYNVHGSTLNQSLAGDIYYFDFRCNILDVFSASVSVRQSTEMSAVYRDSNYFSYSSANLPLSINRFFLVEKQIFFVYNDGSLLVKANWMLDRVELSLVLQARRKLRSIQSWRERAANLVGGKARRTFDESDETGKASVGGGRKQGAI